MFTLFQAPSGNRSWAVAFIFSAFAFLGLQGTAFAQEKPRGDPGFFSPSGNIVCYPTGWNGYEPVRDGVICLIFAAQWQSAPDDPGCGLDETNMFVLGRTGPVLAERACHGDVFWPWPDVTLEYGESLTIGGVTCFSETSGMRCENREGYYFSLSRRGYETGK